VLDVFHMCGNLILGTIQENIAELVDVIGKVAPGMHLNKVEIRFTMDQFHTSGVLFYTIVIMDLVPF